MLVPLITALSFAAPTVAPPASAATFNRTAAVNYANSWARDCSPSACTQMRNSAYYSFSNDCTNFASQVWQAAGIAERYYSSPYWYGRRALGSYTPTWTVVDSFGSHMVNGVKVAVYRTAAVSERYNPASQGDAVLWDLGVGRYNHTTIEMGWSGSYWYHGKNYAGDYINQHTTDRVGAPWNYGYLNESDPDRKRRYRAVVVHFNG